MRAVGVRRSPVGARFKEAEDLRRWGRGRFAMLVGMRYESESEAYEERAWEYFLQLQPSIADVNAAAELAFRAVDAFNRGLERRRTQKT
jgi:hypothetical protein